MIGCTDDWGVGDSCKRVDGSYLLCIYTKRPKQNKTGPTLHADIPKIPRTELRVYTTKSWIGNGKTLTIT